MKEIIRKIALLLALLWVGCVPEEQLTISMESQAVEMFVGEELQLHAKLVHSSREQIPLVWSSSNEEVASVRGGLILAKKAGSATVLVTADYASARCQVTVKNVEVTGITLNTSAVTLKIGDKFSLSASLSPSNVTDRTIKWATSNPSVVAVDGHGLVMALKDGVADITATSGSKSATCKVTVEKIGVEEISLTPSELNLTEGETYSLSATVLPENATDKTVTWTSDAPTLAKVDPAGRVTAVKAGTAAIMAEAGGKFAICSVSIAPKVIDVTGVILDKVTLSLVEEDSYTLIATVTPSNATDKTVTWSSSDPSVASVTTSGKITALKAGTATITAKAGTKTATCEVTVAAKVIEVTGITLDRTTLSMIESDTYTLTATITPSNATNKAVTWSSSDPSVASVTTSGKITALKSGAATITAKAGTKTATCEVTVAAKVIEVTGITLDKTTLSMTEGETYTLSATVTPTDATDKTVTWSSSNLSVASVSTSGEITALTSGTATITAKAGTKTAMCEVTVAAKVIEVTGIKLDKTTLDIEEEETCTLTATLTPSDATSIVTWISSRPSVATVSSDGTVTGIKAGSATITAKAGTKSATCSVTVTAKPVHVTSVSLNYTELNLKTGESADLNPIFTPSNASNHIVTWTSSKTIVATVNSVGLVKAYNKGVSYVTVKTQDGGHTATCLVRVDGGVPVTGVTLDNPSLELLVGDTFTLSANVSPSNAYNKVVSWSSNNTSVATVSRGVVTAKSLGTAIISVTTEESSKTATCEVTVKPGDIPVTGVTLSPAILEMTVGDSWKLTPTVIPSNASNQRVKWTSDNTSVASVSSDGEVTAKSLGQATITVRTLEGDKKATCTINVTTARVTGVYLNVSKYSIDLNGIPIILHATVVPSYATDKSVKWSSDNTAVATVSSDGTVTPKGVGEATITVTTNDGGKTASCLITVTGNTSVTGVSLDKTNLSMTPGDTQYLTASVSPSNASNKSVTWTSSNTSVATVSSSGLVTAKAAGTATITVKTADGSKTASCLVSVSPKYEAIRSLVLIPEQYVNGVSSIISEDYSYTPMTLVNKDRVTGTNSEKCNYRINSQVTSIQSTTILRYQMTPATAEVGLSYGDPVTFVYQNAQSNDIVLSGLYMGCENGVISVKLDVAGGIDSNYPTANIAVQIPDKNGTVVTSQFTPLYRKYYGLRIAQHGSLDIHYRRAICGIGSVDPDAYNNTVPNAVAIDYSSIRALCDTAVSHTGSLDLKAMAALHIIQENSYGYSCSGGLTNTAMKDLGLTWKYEIVKNYLVGANQTAQDQFVTLSDGVLSPIVYDDPAYALAAVGRTPIVRVTLLKGSDIVEVVYIKVFIKE